MPIFLLFDNFQQFIRPTIRNDSLYHCMYVKLLNFDWLLRAAVFVRGSKTKIAVIIFVGLKIDVENVGIKITLYLSDHCEFIDFIHWLNHVYALLLAASRLQFRLYTSTHGVWFDTIDEKTTAQRWTWTIRRFIFLVLSWLITDANVCWSH